ncbi:hypothetical protein PACTADRAFT_3984 [Pachysolen tannophilus NRRL Y-2460]|uniref:Cytochrome P450 n=1 Tax=Pachysolen tannophilus NRRL Y-2460 TaxID=669874 RepID=A0A1E4TQK0_PACTA|nr:hypothetical protein PACTADRAFT_3984 [Pachysolen tannophilus NRRL Y-2460]
MLKSMLEHSKLLGDSFEYVSYAALILFVLFTIYEILQIGKRNPRLPPGPPTVPIFGNFLQIPKKNVHLKFQEWAKTYGPIYSLILGTKVVIVLNSPDAIKELLDKKSTIYSSRPEIYVGQDLISGGLRFVFLPYNDTWRMARKMIHKLLNIKAAVKYIPYQEQENRQMMVDLLNNPDDFHKHLRRYSTSLTTQLVFGWRSPLYEDPKVSQIFEGFEKFAVASQISHSLMDYFPILRYVPDFLNPSARQAKELHKEEKALYMSYMVNCREAIKEGKVGPCFCADMLESQKKLGFSDDLACYISGTLLEAGSDTTAGVLVGFIMAMVCFPEVQKIAREEVDRVVGPDRMPTMDDEENLQYIRWVEKETLRWMPTSIMGIAPHSANKDDEYMGYWIPAGAHVINNVWTLNHDEKRYPKPREFKPERYVNDSLRAGESAALSDANLRDHFTFGAGRRICPGMHLAERSLFLAMARILWTFEISHATDSEGNEIPVNPLAISGGIVARHEPFKAKFTVRSKSKEDLVRGQWAETEATFEKDKLF